MTERAVILRNSDDTIQRVNLTLPGNSVINPPSILVYMGKMYHYTGSSGGVDWVNRYKEVTDSYYII
jgi:hypothetical protein